MKARRLIFPVIAVASLAWCAASSAAESPQLNPASSTTVNPGAPALGGAVVPMGPMDIGWMAFMNTITRLNMTPEFTLDKETKVKLLAIQEEFAAARAKYAKEHTDEITEVNKDLVGAYKAGDRSKIQEAQKASEALWAKAPKSDEYIAKAKALLSGDQVKAVEESLNHTKRATRVNQPKE